MMFKKEEDSKVFEFFSDSADSQFQFTDTLLFMIVSVSHSTPPLLLRRRISLLSDLDNDSAAGISDRWKLCLLIAFYTR